MIDDLTLTERYLIAALREAETAHASRSALEARQAQVDAGQPRARADSSAPAERACAACGEPFERTTQNRRYCSDRCRIRTNSARRANGRDPMSELKRRHANATT